MDTLPDEIFRYANDGKTIGFHTTMLNISVLFLFVNDSGKVFSAFSEELFFLFPEKQSGSGKKMGFKR